MQETTELTVHEVAQRNQFNRIIWIVLAVVVVIPAAIWIQDALSEPTGFLPHLAQWFALMLLPVLWVVGNIGTLITFAAKRPIKPTKLFVFQCVVSGLILLGAFVFWLGDQRDKHVLHQRWAVRDAILTQDVHQVQQAIEACGEACKHGEDFDDWLALSVAVNSPAIFKLLSQDARFHQTPWVGLNAPYVSLNYSCKGYYVGEANMVEIAALHEDDSMLKLILPYASPDEKNAALWYAVRANQINKAEWLLKQGADPTIKDALGIEHNGRSLLDAAVEGYAVESLQWLLTKGYPANGPIGQAETNQLKHTPLHTLIYATENELSKKGNIQKSLQMLAALLKGGADTTIAKPHEYSPPLTALQELLEGNVYEQSAYVVQQMVKHGLTPHDLTLKQQKKFTEFLNTNTDAMKNELAPSDGQCAEALLKKGMKYD